MQEMSVKFLPPHNMECPFCKRVDSIYEGESPELMDDDYVIYPMIWCCECEARCVIDPETYKKFIESLGKDKHGELEVKTETTVPLLFIKRVSHGGLYDGKISEEDLNECTNEFDKRGKKNWKEFEKISIPVESYDVSRPKDPYPPNTDLRHDGVYVLIEVEELDGSTTVIAYWGD